MRPCLLFPQVSFTGEIGFGFRGVMTEFFYCLFEEMTQPEYGLFTYPEEASCMWFPVKVSSLHFTGAIVMTEIELIRYHGKLDLEHLLRRREELIDNHKIDL